MLQTVNGELNFPLHKVVYKQHGKEYSAYTNDKKWWEDFAEKWKHTEIVEFTTPEFTDEQHRRLEEVKDLDEAYAHFAERYALQGLFPDELEDKEERVSNHPLKELQLEKRSTSLGQQNTALEIENFMLKGQAQNLGQQNTTLELEDMMTKGQIESLGQQVTSLELQLLQSNLEG